MVEDIYGRAWIIENAKKTLEEYTGGITIRQLHYRLVSLGMINDLNHYKRVVDAMTGARWDGIVDMEAFIDRERSMYGETKATEKDLDDEIQNAKDQIKAWMKAYGLERWSNQQYFVEVWIEKKALQGVFEGPCRDLDVGLAPCKGYPSLTFLNDASKRFHDAHDDGKEVVILYFGDYDPSGEDIPRSIKDNLSRMGYDVDVKRIALHPEQIRSHALPGVPPKETDSRTTAWAGSEVVELDAVEPDTLSKMCMDAIGEYFDEDLFDELKEREETERTEYQRHLRDFVNNLK